MRKNRDLLSGLDEGFTAFHHLAVGLQAHPADIANALITLLGTKSQGWVDMFVYLAQGSSGCSLTYRTALHIAVVLDWCW